MMNAREERYLKYLQQRVQDSQQLAAHTSSRTTSAIFSARADAFEEAAGKFLEMIDERDEAENAF